MIPHPKTMQMVTDQRWDELQVKTRRERLGMATHEQQPGSTSAGASVIWSEASRLRLSC